MKMQKNSMYGESRQYPKRTRVTIPEIIEKFPDGLTLVHFKIAETKFGANTICHVKEDETVYFFGGKILTEELQKMCDACRGGQDGINNIIDKAGGWPLSYEVRTGKQGQTYYMPHLEY